MSGSMSGSVTRRQPGVEPSVRAGAEVVLVVEDINAAGDGVGRAGGLVVFVPGTIPGDRVRVVVKRVRRSHAEAHCLELLAASAARVAAECVLQERCGGCPLMVAQPDAALGWKVRHLQQTLQRIGGVSPPLERVLSSPQTLAYRGRLSFRVAPRRKGAWLGFHAKKSPAELVAVDTCLLAPPRASELARSFLSRLDSVTRRRSCPWPRRISVRGSLARSEWLLVVHTPPGAFPEAKRAAQAEWAAQPDLVGVVRLCERAGRAPRSHKLAGAGRVVERIGSLDVPQTPTAFVQVHPAMAEQLYREIGRLLDGPPPVRRVLELYGGLGLVGLLAVDELATAPVEVLVVERDSSSVRLGRGLADSRRRGRAGGRDRMRFVAAPVEQAVPKLLSRGEKFDRVVANPPRAGLGPGTAAAIAALEPQVIVLVSCHPATLARDVARLVSHGYEVSECAAVDMFPQTQHLEALARLVPRAVAR